MKSTAMAVAMAMTVCAVATGSEPIKMVDIPAGYFYMGSRALGEDFDEGPVHKVTLTRPMRMSATEITNAQYEEFFPEHRALRGKNGVSDDDNDAVVNVSYHDALEFCKKLGQRESRIYRLPTEAEWEYACRGGTYTLYNTGDWFPDSCQKSQRVARDFDPVSLRVGQFAPNAFGLYDMHGNVEEWCMDYYGPYTADEATDPCGPAQGEYRVTRGGSHHTPVKYLRSANRSAMLPDDRHSPDRIPHSGVGRRASALRRKMECAGSTPRHIGRGIHVGHSVRHPIVPAADTVCRRSAMWQRRALYSHNHQPAVTWCDNGDLLAIWFSANEENGREVTVLSSRLKAGCGEWEEAREFFRVPDRNLTGSSLLNDGNGTLLHINGMEASGDWQNLAMIARRSHDNGATWSAPEIIAPEHTRRHQVIAGPSITAEGWIIQACDAGPGGNDGTALHISRDGGHTWEDPGTALHFPTSATVASEAPSPVFMPEWYNSPTGRSWLSAGATVSPAATENCICR